MEMAVRERAESPFIDEVIKWAHEDLGLDYSDIADALGVDVSTLTRWRNHETEPSKSNYRKLIQLQQMRSMLERIFPDQDAHREWLHEPIEDDLPESELGPTKGLPPYALLVEGQLDPLVEDLASIDSGTYL